MWKYQEQKTLECNFLRVSHTKLGWMRKFPYFRIFKYTKAWLFRAITFPYTYLRTDNKFSFALLLSTFINTPHSPTAALHYVKRAFHKRILCLQSTKILYYTTLFTLLALLSVCPETNVLSVACESRCFFLMFTIAPSLIETN